MDGEPGDGLDGCEVGDLVAGRDQRLEVGETAQRRELRHGGVGELCVPQPVEAAQPVEAVEGVGSHPQRFEAVQRREGRQVGDLVGGDPQPAQSGQARDRR